jgi:adenine-specific DNA-methyltransferase
MFKAFVPSSRAEARGIVYTKRWVVDLLLDLAGYAPDRNLADLTAVEPAAGDGAFLGPMIERLMASCQVHKRDVEQCGNSLIAYEIDEVSAERARQIATSILTSHGIAQTTADKLANAWVRTGDYLTEAMTVRADFVVGNPPYIRLEEIPEQVAEMYRSSYSTMRGRADVYIAFFEAALSQLKPDGVCAFICADRWMRNQYGAELRQLVTAAYSLDIVLEMHNADPFHDEVDAYPAITVIRHKQQGPVLVAKANLEAERIDTGELSVVLQNTTMYHLPPLPNGVKAAVVERWFHGSEPWPCNSPEQLKLLRRLEDNFPPLEPPDKSTRVGIGVATGNDGIFITKDPELVEPSRLLKLALANDISSGVLNWSGHYLIDPWDKDGLVSLFQFPRLSAYFDQHSSQIRKRNTAQKNPAGWYRTIDRVSHELTTAPKLYIADIKNALSPVLDRGETYPHHNLYYVQSSEWDLQVLGGLLMSVVGQFFVESYGVRMRGGYFRFQAQYLRRIRVPAVDALPKAQAAALKTAFQKRDQAMANRVALELYGIEADEMEAALGH